MSKNWFKDLFGFAEDASRVRQLMTVSPAADGSGLELFSSANQRRFPIGSFSTLSVLALRAAFNRSLTECSTNTAEILPVGVFTYENIAIDDTRALHKDKPGAMFQAASQMNALEFPSPRVVPEDGITGYVFDRTQGPACALACAAGTAYRNYFHPMATDGREQQGQTADLQINNLDELENFLENSANHYWEVRNGYVFSTEERLAALNERLKSIPPDEMTSLIKIGLHSNVGVTDAESGDVRVSQAYCSALSCAYSGVDVEHWEPFATLVLNGMYEGTIMAALLNRESSREVYLTFLGGGVFGNKKEWIANAIGRAMAIAQSYSYPPVNQAISVKICHYKSVDREMLRLIDRAFAHHGGRSD
jgi:hypothetical protein